MSVLATSITSITLAEIGDKTQLLSLLLISRYRKPVAIVFGILLATLLNHFVAAWLGVVIADWLSPTVLKWLVVLSFASMAAWVLVPDSIDSDQKFANRGPFLASFIAFSIAEIGDKTQIATSILGAQYSHALAWVVLGTTIGMMLANVPVIIVGQLSADKIPMNWVRRASAVAFAVMAIIAWLSL
ncbi:TMEM165/GDT1 family protein [Vibrio marisflavi]|uniref:GDT1 family protein n=1 Tax=Vibrio marisflavi CECT 7928 TaxID=634439 RepID=A0ABM9A8M4_9VIBR|nr:TMEM165/GDT1 family protein [Vibrio marisflavi]CAH0541934.1 Putative manganese exporter [Vibrio marisflavi CECT 7928]